MPLNQVINYFIHSYLTRERLPPPSDFKLLFHLKQAKEGRLRDLHGDIIIAVTIGLATLLHHNFNQRTLHISAQFERYLSPAPRNLKCGAPKELTGRAA